MDRDMQCVHARKRELPFQATLVVELRSDVDHRLDVPKRETRICARCVCTALAALLAIDGETVV